MTTYQQPGPPAEPVAPPVEILAEGEWSAPEWSPPGEGPTEELPDSARSRPARYRWWRGPQSLTGRLVSGVVALVVLLVLAVGMATYWSLHSYMLNRLDQQVRQLAAANAQSILRCEQQSPPTGGTCGIGLGSGGRYRAPTVEWVVVVNTDGTPAFTVTQPSDSLLPLKLSAAQTRSFIANPGDTRRLTTTDGSTLQVTAATVPAVSGDTPFGQVSANAAVVISGLSTSDLDRTMQRLVLLELLIGGAAVLVAFAATAGGVELSLRRLRRVTATAHEVAAELSPSGAGLERRVPVESHDTTEVGQLATSVNTLLAAVETQFSARVESEQRMRQFLADASHELRTPLTSIRGYAELARMQRDRPEAEANGYAEPDSENLDRIEAEGTRMSRLIDDLLLLARTDQAQEHNAAPVQQYVEVDELLEEVVSGSRAAFPTRQIHLEVAPGLALIGDPDQLHRAVRNLVNNAAVHTRADGPIGVRAVREGADIVIQVADSGPGLPPEEAAHVFERFWRADKARTRARGGSGLGMSIVASIVGAHQGQVRFDSSVDTGSTVSIRLPSGLN